MISITYKFHRILDQANNEVLFYRIVFYIVDIIKKYL